MDRDDLQRGRRGHLRHRQLRPSVVLVDLLMPDVDGFEVIDALHVDPRTAAIPVVVLTAKSLTAQDRRAAAGAHRVRGVQGRAGPQLARRPVDARWRPAGGAGRGVVMSELSVLLVEDNPRNLKLARDVLEYAGFAVTAVTTGEEALPAARAGGAGRHPDGPPAARHRRARRAVPAAGRPGDRRHPRRGRQRVRDAGRPGARARLRLRRLPEKPISVRDFPDQVRGHARGAGGSP